MELRSISLSIPYHRVVLATVDVAAAEYNAATEGGAEREAAAAQH